MDCIITGCALVRPDGKWLPVDLFQTAGGTYIANGPRHDSTVMPEENWIDGPPAYTKTITMRHWWERGGVFVIELSYATLNEAASRYVGN